MRGEALTPGDPNEGGPNQGGQTQGGQIQGGSIDGCDSVAGPLDGDPQAPVAAAERYLLGGLIGRGGMGHVLAAHDRLLARDVALKIMRPDLAGSPAAAARLAAEARVTAGLDHPAIVAVHDAGTAADGTPFYVMRLVRGRSLADEIAARPMLAERLGLLRAVLTATEALAYAHHRGVVHRDVKPHNVMLGEFGEVQVMDWGLATHVGDAASGPVGTTAYMSPEQARGAPVSDRSDVWSLGVLLLEVVLGRPPSPDALADTLATLARPRGTPAPPPELVALIARCLAPEPAQRQSARALAEDLERFLDGRRVAAYDYPFRTLLARRARAWRVPLIVGAVALVVLIAVLVVGRARLVAERDRATQAHANLLSAQAVTHFEAGRLAEAELSAADALSADSTAGPVSAARANALGALMARHAAATRVAEFNLPSDSGAAASGPARACALPQLDPDGRWLLCLGAGQASVWQAAPELASGWRLGWTRASTAARGHILPAAGSVVLLETDGPADGASPKWPPALTLRRFSLASGAHEASFAGWDMGELLPTRSRAVAFNAGTLVVAPEPAASAVPARPVGSARAGGQVLEMVAVKLESACRSRINAVAVTPDERGWVVACSDGALVTGPLGELPTRALAPAGVGGDDGIAGLTAMALGPGQLAWGDPRGQIGLARIAGDRVEVLWQRALPGAVTRLWLAEVLFVTLADGAVRVLSLAGDDLTSLPAGAATRGFTRAAEHLLTLGDDRLAIWAPPAAWLPHRLLIAPGVGLTGAVPSPDGRLLAASVADGRLVIVDVSGRRVASPRPRSELVKPVAWRRDGRELSGSWMGTAGLVTLETATWQEVEPGARSRGAAARRVLALAGDLMLAVAYDKGSTLHVGAHTWRTTPELEADVFVDGAASLDGAHALLVPAASAAVTIMDIPGPVFRRVVTSAPAQAGDVADDGTTIVLARASGVVVLDAASGHERALAPCGARVLDLALLPDGRHAAGGVVDGTVAIWSLASGELVARLRAHDERTAYVEALPDGRTLVSASWDGTVRLWDLSMLDATPEALARRLAAWGPRPPL